MHSCFIVMVFVPPVVGLFLFFVGVACSSKSHKGTDREKEWCWHILALISGSIMMSASLKRRFNERIVVVVVVVDPLHSSSLPSAPFLHTLRASVTCRAQLFLLSLIRVDERTRNDFVLSSRFRPSLPPSLSLFSTLSIANWRCRRWPQPVLHRLALFPPTRAEATFSNALFLAFSLDLSLALGVFLVTSEEKSFS